MSQENVEAVMELHAAVTRGDLQGVLSRCHPAIEYRAAIQQAMEGEAGVFRGYDGLRRWFGELHDLYADLETEVVEVRDLGDSLVVVFVVRGRGTRSGINLEQLLAQVIELRRGRIVAVRDYLSPGEAFEAVRLSG